MMSSCALSGAVSGVMSGACLSIVSIVQRRCGPAGWECAYYARKRIRSVRSRSRSFVIGRRLQRQILQELGHQRHFGDQHLDRDKIARFHLDTELDLPALFDDLAFVDMPKPAEKLGHDLSWMKLARRRSCATDWTRAQRAREGRG